MTTLEERICLLEWWRDRCIGNAAAACYEDIKQGEPYHAPELCAAEMEEICEWEAELRGEGPAAEDAYQIIRRESKRDWEAKHGDGDWHDSESMNARVSAYLARSATPRISTNGSH